MMFTEYLVGLITILWKFAIAFCSAILFRPCWNCTVNHYIGEWVPTQFHNIPFWHFVGIILTIMFIGDMINKLVPTIVNISNDTDNSVTNNNNTDKE